MKELIDIIALLIGCGLILLGLWLFDPEFTEQVVADFFEPITKLFRR